MSVFRPARHYLPASLATAALAAVSAWCGTFWIWAFLPALALLGASCGLYYLGSRPSIEIGDYALRLGAEALPWDSIERVDMTAWSSPLILIVTMTDGRRVRLVHPGEPGSGERLTRQIRRRARAAAAGPTGPTIDDRPGVGLLSAEDENEILRLYQQLRAAGRMDVTGADE